MGSCSIEGVQLRLTHIDNILKLVNELCPMPGVILDVGCGTGEITKAIQGHKVVSMDADPRYNPDIVHDLNAANLPFHDERFNLALMIDLVEHLDKSVGLRLLHDIRQFVEGCILVITPRVWDDNKWAYETEDSGYYHNLYVLHRSLWTEEDFVGWENADLKTLNKTHYVKVLRCPKTV